MGYYTVKVQIPTVVEKEIYIDDATSITDAKRKAKAWGRDEYDSWDASADVYGYVDYSKLKIVSVKEGE